MTPYDHGEVLLHIFFKKNIEKQVILVSFIELIAKKREKLFNLDNQGIYNQHMYIPI